MLQLFFRHRFFAFWLVISVLYAVIFVTIEFAGSPFTGLNGFLSIALQWSCVAITASAIILLMAVNRWVFSLLWMPFIILCTISAYYKWTLGVSLTAQSVELAMVNNATTWATVITWPLIAVCMLGLACSALTVWIRCRYVRCRHSVAYVVAGIVVVMIPTTVVKRMQGPVYERLPLSIYSSFSQYVENMHEIASIRHQFDSIQAVTEADSLTVVFVVGESLRADHLQLNGYERATTPRLVSERNLVSFPNIRTIPYFTHTSVPYILSRADSVNQRAGYTEPSFITLFKKAGFSTYWLSNQDSGFAYIYFMHEADSLCNLDTGRSPYSFSKWLDADLLPHFNSVISSHTDSTTNKLVVMHTIGSHWWYPTHYTEEEAVFKPEVRSRVMSEVTAEEMINSYDNTIVATDRFLHSVMESLRGRQAVLIFISDHGEALGEDGNFLHAEDYPQLHNPACFVWWSDAYGRRYPERVAALRRNAGAHFLTDAMFHTALDAANIITPELKTGESLMRRQDKPNAIADE